MSVTDLERAPAVRVAPRRNAIVGWLQAGGPESLRVFVLTRVLFVLLTYFGVILHGNFQSAHPSLIHFLVPAWNQWDTQWYDEIAQRGYGWTKSVGTGPAAFFPLYPLLIKITVLVTHRSFLVAALLVSNVAFVLALLYLWKLTQWETDGPAANRTILYVAVFPTALFFFAGYTESLFLLLTVASFYSARRGNWVAAGVAGGLASATRVTGVLLLVPLAYEYARDANFSPRQMMRPGLVSFLLIPAGLAAFMLYLSETIGDAMAFVHYQAAWQKVFTLKLWAGFLDSLREIFITQPAGSFFEAHNVINVVLGGAFLLATILVARRLPAAYTLYLVAFWLVTLTSPAISGGYPVPLVSLSRYVLSLFPVFIAAGQLGRDRFWNDSYLVVSTGMLAVLTVQFVNGGWVV